MNLRICGNFSFHIKELYLYLNVITCSFSLLGYKISKQYLACSRNLQQFNGGVDNKFMHMDMQLGIVLYNISSLWFRTSIIIVVQNYRPDYQLDIHHNPNANYPLLHYHPIEVKEPFLNYRPGNVIQNNFSEGLLCIETKQLIGCQIWDPWRGE